MLYLSTNFKSTNISVHILFKDFIVLDIFTDVTIKQWDFNLKNHTTNFRISIDNVTIFNKENAITKYILEKYSQIAT